MPPKEFYVPYVGYPNNNKVWVVPKERNVPVSLVRGTGPGQGSDGNGTSEGEEIATRKHEFQIIICNMLISFACTEKVGNIIYGTNICI